MDAPAKKRPWYRLTWVTIITLLMVYFAFVALGKPIDIVFTDALMGSEGLVFFKKHGWPLRIEGEVDSLPEKDADDIVYWYREFTVLTNLVLCLLLLVCMAFVLEKILRRGIRKQFQLSTLFMVTWIVAGVTVCFNPVEIHLARPSESYSVRMFFTLLHIKYGLVNILVVIPLACVFYVLGLLGWRLLQKMYAVVIPLVKSADFDG